jgi:hypothetical protein
MRAKYPQYEPSEYEPSEIADRGITLHDFPQQEAGVSEHRLNAENLIISWVDRGFEPRCASDPKTPDGVDLDMSKGAERTCARALPYPAKRCGYFVVNCEDCGLSACITTAGRRDDPRSITLACKERFSHEN